MTLINSTGLSSWFKCMKLLSKAMEEVYHLRSAAFAHTRTCLGTHVQMTSKTKTQYEGLKCPLTMLYCIKNYRILVDKRYVVYTTVNFSRWHVNIVECAQFDMWTTPHKWSARYGYPTTNAFVIQKNKFDFKKRNSSRGRKIRAANQIASVLFSPNSAWARLRTPRHRGDRG